MFFDAFSSVCTTQHSIISGREHVSSHCHFGVGYFHDLTSTQGMEPQQNGTYKCPEPFLSSSEAMVVTAVDVFPSDPPIKFIIREVFRNFNFGNESGLLQFWACTKPPNSEDTGWCLMLKDQPFVSTGDNEKLEDHRRRCLEINGHFVGHETKVDHWIAGRAVQTGIADQRPVHSEEAAGKGQLVLPVFLRASCPKSEKKLVGIIELATIGPKESYIEDFLQLFHLLQLYGLQSKYMGKIIKVDYNGCLIKFRLSYWARLNDLYKKVAKRFPEIGHQNFRIAYKDITNGIILYPISSDEHLQHRMYQSSLSRETVIRMQIC